MWRNLIRANAAYVIGTVANSAALFLLIPFLVNALPPEEYGAWSILEITILIVTMIFVAGLDVGVMRHYWYLEGEQSKARLIGTVLLAIVFWGGALTVVGLVLIRIFPIFEEISNASQNLTLVLGICFVESLLVILLTLFRIREKPGTFAFLSVGKMLLFVGLTIWLVQIYGNTTSILIGRLIACLIILLIAIPFSIRFIKFTFDPGMFRSVARYGLPMIPTALASYILLASDRYVMGFVATLELVAIYTFAYKIATTMNVLITRPFALDWAPRRFKIASDTRASLKYGQILVLYLFAVTVFSLLIIAVTPLIYSLVAPDLYRDGLKIVPLILLAYIIFGLSYPLNIGIMLKDKTRYLPVIGGIAAAVCFLLNVWWIQQYGMLGAALATIVGYTVWTGGIAWMSQRLYPVHHQYGLIVRIVAAGLVGYGVLWLIDQVMVQTDSELLVVGLKVLALGPILIFAGYPILSYLRKTYHIKSPVAVSDKAVSS